MFLSPTPEATTETLLLPLIKSSFTPSVLPATTRQEASSRVWSAAPSPRWPPRKLWTRSPITRGRTPPCSRGRSGTGCWQRACVTATRCPAWAPLTGDKVNHEWNHVCASVVQQSGKVDKGDKCIVGVIKSASSRQRCSSRETLNLPHVLLPSALICCHRVHAYFQPIKVVFFCFRIIRTKVQQPFNLPLDGKGLSPGQTLSKSAPNTSTVKLVYHRPYQPAFSHDAEGLRLKIGRAHCPVGLNLWPCWDVQHRFLLSVSNLSVFVFLPPPSPQFSGHPSRISSVRLPGLHLLHQRPAGYPSSQRRGQEEPRWQ